ncbi:hypothetical protein AGMMS49992_00580 [Clostridia bacterium]|nr:hypothetical protein AGMMS49992_00580 [Clostridia bacterium]
MIRRVSVILLCVIIMSATASTVLAESAPYQSYTFDYWGVVKLTPPPYLPERSISGATLGITPLSQARDITIADDGTLYIADTGNNRIIIVEPDLRTVRAILTGFDNGGNAERFASPSGIALSETGGIYIADSGNRRVVVLEPDARTLVKIVQNPKNEALPSDFVFTPLRVAVDYAGRIYVIAQNMFQGIMMFDPDGTFTGFYGTIGVTITMWERFWRALSSKQERANSRLYIPTEFTGLDVDPVGFVYASYMDPKGTKAVSRLNPKGEDVAKTGVNKNLGGDLEAAEFGASRIVDVTYQGKGIYSLLDSTRGRIFTYDHEGNLLYTFGGLGSQVGTFRTPTAIACAGGRILVLDQVRSEIAIFQETEYGRLINEAVGLRFDGDETLAVEKWRQVLMLNGNLELANVGIGKAYLTSGDNYQAMQYLRLGMSRDYYSIAFKRYRNEILKENLGWILTAAVTAVAAIFIVTYLRKRKRTQQDTPDTGVMDDV